MEKKERGKVLDRLFDEIENQELSKLEQDHQLREIGINPEKLIKDSFQKLNKYLKKDSESTDVIKLNQKQNHLLAAKKEKNGLEDLKRKMDNIDNENNNL